MKAVAVFPGKPNSAHLREVPKPSVDSIPDGRGILVKVLRVGLDGTDKEINALWYNALRAMADFARRIGESGAAYETMADRTRGRFPPILEHPGRVLLRRDRRPGWERRLPSSQPASGRLPSAQPASRRPTESGRRRLRAGFADPPRAAQPRAFLVGIPPSRCKDPEGGSTNG